MIRKKLKFLVLICFAVGLLLSTAIFPAFSQTSRPNADIQLIEEGKELYTNHQFEEAAAAWDKAAQTYKERGDDYSRAIALTYLSLAYQKLQRWSPAKDAIDTSLEIAQNYPILRAQALNARGSLELALGQTETALNTWQLATQAYERAGDETGRIGSLINQAQALEELGLYRRTCKTLLQALEFDPNCDFSDTTALQPILEAFKQQKNLQIKILGLRSLGNIFRSLGEFESSGKLLKESLTFPQPAEEKSMTWLNLGKTERAKAGKTQNMYDRTKITDERDKAIAQANRALDYYQEAANQSNSNSLKIQAYLQQLSLLIELRQWLTQQQDNKNAADLSTQINAKIAQLRSSQIDRLPASRTSIYAKLSFARSLSQLERDREAFQYTSTAVEQAKAIGDPRSQSYALGTLGNLYEKNKQWGEAQTLTEQALGIAQSIQAEDIAYQWQWQIGRIDRANGKTKDAIAAYNAAVATLDAVREDLIAIDSEVQFSFRENVELVYRELVELLLIDRNNTQPSQDNIKKATQIIDSLQLAELENFLSCNLAPLVEISDRQVDPNAALIYPIILRDRLEIILKLPQSTEFRLYSIAIAASQVEQTLDNLRRELEQPYPSPEGKALSEQVYNWLIQPAQTLLEQDKIKTLVFVLDGAFRNVPMAALYDGQQYLIQKGYAVAVIPGLQLLQSQPLKRLNLNTLAFGLSEIRGNFPPHQGFSPLINVESELQEIRSLLPSRELLNQNFTSDALQDLIRSQNFSVIHVATHGQFSSDPQQTFILAWDKRIDVNDLSNILQSREQERTDAIELLVLSACKTADGDSRAALGLAGVAIQSGARSVVASLWDINDRSTALLMSSFYQELAKNNVLLSKAEALRQAQLKLLNTPGYELPRFWASYVLVGNWL
ncbi:MAG: CHAT domain-containing protein [Hydrococcus sp. CRU_1_1]|nr:CHAT domain-containing protein [Hydrococcus sp. CRU_1_1]